MLTVPTAPPTALYTVAAILSLACAAPGRRVTVGWEGYKPEPRRTVNIGLNVLTGTTEIGPCVASSEVPTTDNLESTVLKHNVLSWEAEAEYAGHPYCVKWFSRTRDGIYVSLQMRDVTMDGGWLAFTPVDQNREGWVMVPW